MEDKNSKSDDLENSGIVELIFFCHILRLIMNHDVLGEVGKRSRAPPLKTVPTF